MVGNPNDGTNFPHKLLLSNRQNLSLYKAYANNLFADMKLQTTRIWKIIQSNGFLGRLLRS